MAYAEYQERVKTEQKDLAERLDKLTTFIETNNAFPRLAEPDRFLLVKQQGLMSELNDVLLARIERFAQQ